MSHISLGDCLDSGLRDVCLLWREGAQYHQHRDVDCPSVEAEDADDTLHSSDACGIQFGRFVWRWYHMLARSILWLCPGVW
jgi:hypothetical protein